MNFLSLVGRFVEAKENNIQLKTLTSGAIYSAFKYTEASTVYIYKIVNTVVGVVEQLFIVVQIGHIAGGT